MSDSLSRMDMPTPEPALRTAEVAKALGVSARAVRTWADEGKIACYRTFGGHRLFSVSEVRRVLASWGRPGLSVVPEPEVVMVAEEAPLAAGKAGARDETGGAHG